MARTVTSRKMAAKSRVNDYKRDGNGTLKPSSLSEGKAPLSKIPIVNGKKAPLAFLSQIRYMFWTILILLGIPLYYLLGAPAKGFSWNPFPKKEEVWAKAETNASVKETKDNHTLEALGTVSFRGGVLNGFGKVLDGSIYLSCESTCAGVSAEVVFHTPWDIVNRPIVFFARGLQGGEQLKVSATDIDYKTCHPNELFNVSLDRDNKRVIVGSEQIQGMINKHKIAKIRFILEKSPGTDRTLATVIINNIAELHQ
jgi:hypothetical protein